MLNPIKRYSPVSHFNASFAPWNSSPLRGVRTGGWLLLLLVTAMLSGCGVAHVKSSGQGDNWRSYHKVVVGEVKVYSNEAEAKDNPDLQGKLREWQSQARRQVEGYAKSLQGRLPPKPQGGQEKVLVLNLDAEVTYGNRALRYWVGFGAGKGGVNSMLTLADARTGGEIFSANSDSDLSVGAFGGDIGKVFTANLEKLLQQYPQGFTLAQSGN